MTVELALTALALTAVLFGLAVASIAFAVWLEDATERQRLAVTAWFDNLKHRLLP